jgi:hypothetical protein
VHPRPQGATHRLAAAVPHCGAIGGPAMAPTLQQAKAAYLHQAVAKQFSAGLFEGRVAAVNAKVKDSAGVTWPLLYLIECAPRPPASAASVAFAGAAAAAAALSCSHTPHTPAGTRMGTRST